MARLLRSRFWRLFIMYIEMFSGTDVVRKQKETPLEVSLGAFLGDSNSKYNEIQLRCKRLHPALIEETEHPERKFGSVGHIPVIGKNVGILQSGYLRKILASPTNFQSVLVIHLKVSFCLAVLHSM